MADDHDGDDDDAVGDVEIEFHRSVPLVHTANRFDLPSRIGLLFSFSSVIVVCTVLTANMG